MLTTHFLHNAQYVLKSFNKKSFLYILLCINYSLFNAYNYIYIDKDKQCHVCSAAH